MPWVNKELTPVKKRNRDAQKSDWDAGDKVGGESEVRPESLKYLLTQHWEFVLSSLRREDVKNRKSRLLGGPYEKMHLSCHKTIQGRLGGHFPVARAQGSGRRAQQPWMKKR